MILLISLIGNKGIDDTVHTLATCRAGLDHFRTFSKRKIHTIKPNTNLCSKENTKVLGENFISEFFSRGTSCLNIAFKNPPLY